MPYANSHSLRNSMKLMPGVVQDATGALHVNGSSENQVLYLLNGFNITNPISGQFQTLLAVEGIRSVDLSSGRYSPEFGKGSAGVLGVNTENGTDKFHYTATDFIPGLQPPARPAPRKLVSAVRGLRTNRPGTGMVLRYFRVGI